MKGAIRNRKNVKQQVVDSFGGKCQRCEYDRCLRALQFHHKDSSEKDLWSKGRGGASYDEVMAHPERFLLLCANCHIEEHDRIDEAAVLRANCLTCGKEFRSKPCLKEVGKDKYCSRRCQHIQRTEAAITNVEPRFWKHVRKTETCWIWTAYNLNGTGLMNTRNEDGSYSPESANQISWKIHRGAVPPGTRIYHSCENSLCVNPDHLILGSQADGIEAAEVPKAKKKGGKGAKPKLTDDQAEEIRRLYATGAYSQNQLASRFGVAQGTISGVICFMPRKRINA